MAPERTSQAADGRSRCARHDCDRAADFRVYHPEEDRWRPLCERHTLQLHPSLEVHAWLESGYARPVELDPPGGPPGPPRDGRTAAFREVVDRAMDWSR